MFKELDCIYRIKKKNYFYGSSIFLLSRNRNTVICHRREYAGVRNSGTLIGIRM